MTLRDTFRGYYALNASEIDRLWSEGLVVLDTNVLLNLYTYPEDARNDILAALRAVQDRLWIPHHVALEFHRRREDIILKQLAVFDRVRQIIGFDRLKTQLDALNLRKAHSLISTDAVLAAIRPALDQFETDLAEQEKQHVKPTRDDLILDSVLDLIADNVGAPLSSQEVQTAYSDGEKRYTSRIPPGYEDAKTKASIPEFVHGGVSYRPQYGDLIIWKQILKHAKEHGVRVLMFISDDEKQDWRHIVEYKGDRLLTPHPELVHEIQREAGVEVFYIYSSELFLEYAKQRLNVDVRESTIPQVTDVKEATKAAAEIARDDDVSFVQIIGEEGNRRDALLFCSFCNRVDISLHFYEGDGTPKLCDVLGLFHYWDCPEFDGRSAVTIVVLRSNGTDPPIRCRVRE